MGLLRARAFICHIRVRASHLDAFGDRGRTLVRKPLLNWPGEHSALLTCAVRDGASEIHRQPADTWGVGQPQKTLTARSSRRCRVIVVSQPSPGWAAAYCQLLSEVQSPACHAAVQSSFGCTADARAPLKGTCWIVAWEICGETVFKHTLWRLRHVFGRTWRAGRFGRSVSAHFTGHSADRDLTGICQAAR